MTSDARDLKLRRMKWIAGGLLALAAAVYVAATLLEPRYAWLYYVAAAAEASMIGAIADWFAVVALFHHPLNLRFIPHTAIIPRNKQRIALGLSDFIQQNFLSAHAVVERIAQFRPAQTLCRWLLKPQNAEALATYGTRLMAYGLTRSMTSASAATCSTPSRRRCARPTSPARRGRCWRCSPRTSATTRCSSRRSPAWTSCSRARRRGASSPRRWRATRRCSRRSATGCTSGWTSAPR